MKYLKIIGLMVGLVVLGFGVFATNAVTSDWGNSENETKIVRQDDVKSEVRNLSGFSKVDVGGTIASEITVGQDFRVVVEAKESLLSKIITKVEDDTLKVQFEKDWWRSLKSKSDLGKFKVIISLPALDDLDISGASTSTVTGVNSNKLTIDVSGASKVSIEGSAREINIDLSGASSLKADKLFSEMADIDLSGASSADVNVTSDLRVDASGASSVRYTGNPRVQKATSGASSVRQQR